MSEIPDEGMNLEKIDPANAGEAASEASLDNEAAETESMALFARLKGKAAGTPRNLISRDALKRQKKARDHANDVPFAPGRDPLGLGGALDDLTAELGWKPALAQSEALDDWADIVGPDVASRTSVQGITNGILTVVCESTAWATQLKFMSSDVLTKILQKHPDSNITSIRFQGPNAPSWKRGPKSIPGRGPRDTYG